MKMMRKSALSLIGLFLASAFTASAADNSPMTPVEGLFNAMRAANAAAIEAQFTSDAELLRFGPGGEQKETAVKDFAAGIAKFGAGVVDERLHDVTLQQDGSLASVWAPFKIYVGGELKGCGVNHFRLIKKPSGWKISSLADVSRRTGCN